jgi:Ca2+-binding RTX toxin-like protein
MVAAPPREAEADGGAHRSMTTTVNVELSTTLQQTLTNAGAGTYAYALAFGASTPGGDVERVGYIKLVDDGVVTSTTSLSLDSPNFYSGAIYIVIQQHGLGHLQDQLTEIEHLNPTLAQAANFTYQLFEMTLSGSDQDQGDISALNTFGFTSTLEVVYQNGSATRGFQSSASDIFSAFPADAVANYGANEFPDPERLATGPATANDQAPWPSSDWQTYVDALKADPTTLSDIEIVYAFQGSSSDSTAMLSQYSVQYVAKDKYGEDYFWLVPDTSNGATNTDWIQITASELVQNIYVQTGQLTYYAGGRSNGAQQYSSFTPTNPDGGVAKHFVAGFDAGFWGGSGTSPNSSVTDTIDFNKGYNWNVNYAYDAILLNGVGSASYTNSLSSGSGQFYDPWAQQFVANSNAYGYSYSDLVSAGGVNPQVAMYDTATGANVQTVNITVYDTGETPASGFTAGSQGYIAPTAASGDYEDSLTTTTNQIGFNFNFSVGSTLYAPDEATSIVFKIYAPSSPQADSDGFISLNLTTASSSEDWYYYIINENAGAWSVALSNATGLNGFFNIQNIPVTADGSPSWYQLVFGDGDNQTTYNIYATSDQTTGAFTDLVIDHGIEVTPNPNGSYTLAFAPAGHMFYDIDTFAPPPTDDPDTVGVSIIGSKHSDMVNALNSVGMQAEPTGGADYIFGAKGNDYLSGLGGNDTLNGGKGVDHLWGNDGDDILQVQGNEGVYDYFNGGTGTDTLQFLKGNVTLAGFNAAASSIEILDSNGRALLGTKEMDVFDLSGLSQAPDLRFIDGKGGNDIMIGSNFADHLRGDAGDDTLDGRGGDDTLNGGKGLNTYVFADGYDHDTIVKFQAGRDTIDLTGVSSVANFTELLALMEQVDRRTVLIDFGNGDTLTLQKTTIGALTSHQGDFLFA